MFCSHEVIADTEENTSNQGNRANCVYPLRVGYGKLVHMVFVVLREISGERWYEITKPQAKASRSQRNVWIVRHRKVHLYVDSVNVQLC